MRIRGFGPAVGVIVGLAVVAGCGSSSGPEKSGQVPNRSVDVIKADVDHALADPGERIETVSGSLQAGGTVDVYRAADDSAFTWEYLDASAVRQARVVLASFRYEGALYVDAMNVEVDAGPWKLGDVLTALRHDFGGESAGSTSAASSLHFSSGLVGTVRLLCGGMSNALVKVMDAMNPMAHSWDGLDLSSQHETLDILTANGSHAPEVVEADGC